MNETPVLARIPIQNEPLDNVGTALGVQVACKLVLIYAIPSMVFMGIPLLVDGSVMNLRDVGGVVGEIVRRYFALGFLSLMGVMLGMIVAVMIGGFSGRIIGFVFGRFSTRLPRTPFILYSVLLSAGLLLIRLAIPYLFSTELWFGPRTLAELVIADSQNETLWIGWWMPNVIACLGLWWVMDQVNQKLPSAPLTSQRSA